MWHNNFLRLAGLCAIGIALYHGFVGDAAITALEVSPAEQVGFLRSTYQLGTMGWIAGGILLIASRPALANKGPATGLSPSSLLSMVSLPLAHL